MVPEGTDKTEDCQDKFNQPVGTQEVKVLSFINIRVDLSDI